MCSVLHEVQTIETDCTSGGALGGTFALGLDTRGSGGSSEMSGEISYHASPEGGYLSVKSVLEGMKNVGPGGVVGVERAERSGTKGSFVWTVTFATHLGDIPELTLRYSSLTGTGATVLLNTVQNQNLLGGTFRLSFGGYTTASIPHDATGGEVAGALEGLSPVDSVVVLRLGPDDQGGYNWTVTFTSDFNGGNIEEMVPVYNDLEGRGAAATVHTLRDGNELSGSFNVSWPEDAVLLPGARPPTSPRSTIVPFDATSSQLKAALENEVGTGEVDVQRVGPDFEAVSLYSFFFNIKLRSSRLFTSLPSRPLATHHPISRATSGACRS